MPPIYKGLTYTHINLCLSVCIISISTYLILKDKIKIENLTLSCLTMFYAQYYNPFQDKLVKIIRPESGSNLIELLFLTSPHLTNISQKPLSSLMMLMHSHHQHYLDTGVTRSCKIYSRTQKNSDTLIYKVDWNYNQRERITMIGKTNYSKHVKAIM